MLDLNIPTKALFLDRDGIINIDHGYVNKIEDFTFNEKIFELMHLFIKKHFKLFIVTNQSGIGRGYYSIDDFEKLSKWMLKVLKQEKIEIEAIKFCQHSPETKCGCRKPQTGMIDEILKEYNIDLESSWMIGDKQSDIDLATNAKIGKSISIGNRDIAYSDYHFRTIEECFEFLRYFKL